MSADEPDVEPPAETPDEGAAWDPHTEATSSAYAPPVDPAGYSAPRGGDAARLQPPRYAPTRDHPQSPSDGQQSWYGPLPGYPPPAYGPPTNYPPPGYPPPAYGQPPNYPPPGYPAPGYGPPVAYGGPGGRASSASGEQPGYGPPEAYADVEERTGRGRTLTPARGMAVIALVTSGAVAAYSLLIARGSQSIALTVAALAIFGLMCAVVGFSLAAAGVRAARAGSVARAFAGGLSGGLFMLAASGALASAVIFGLLSRG